MHIENNTVNDGKWLHFFTCVKLIMRKFPEMEMDCWNFDKDGDIISQISEILLQSFLQM